MHINAPDAVAGNINALENLFDSICTREAAPSQNMPASITIRRGGEPDVTPMGVNDVIYGAAGERVIIPGESLKIEGGGQLFNFPDDEDYLFDTPELPFTIKVDEDLQVLSFTAGENIEEGMILHIARVPEPHHEPNIEVLRTEREGKYLAKLTSPGPLVFNVGGHELNISEAPLYITADDNKVSAYPHKPSAGLNIEAYHDTESNGIFAMDLSSFPTRTPESRRHFLEANLGYALAPGTVQAQKLRKVYVPEMLKYLKASSLDETKDLVNQTIAKYFPEWNGKHAAKDPSLDTIEE
jgi:hypothetical protein